MFILTALIETAQLTTKKIRAMLLLKDEFEKQTKQIFGTSFSYELLQVMFTLPYLKIELMEKRALALWQTASVWLEKLINANILKPQKIGRTTYYINYRLMELLTEN